MSVKKTCFSVGWVGALLTCVACSTNVLDLGTNTVADGGPSALSLDGGLTTVAAGCTEWIDDDIHAAQEGECAGSCTVSKGGERQPFASRKAFIDHTGGPWFTCDGSAPFGPSGAARTIIVRPLASLAELPLLLDPLSLFLQSAALAAPPERRREIATLLASAGVTRVTQIGKQGWPGPLWHHDGRDPLRSLIRWSDIEHGQE